MAAANKDTVGRRVMRPMEAYIHPGRRRTDNPLVVGIVVLCLGIIAVGMIVQISATVWAGSQVKILLDGQLARDQQVHDVRERLFKNTEAQAFVLRRLCLNTLKDEKERAECLVIGPNLTTPPITTVPKASH